MNIKSINMIQTETSKLNITNFFNAYMDWSRS